MAQSTGGQLSLLPLPTTPKGKWGLEWCLGTQLALFTLSKAWRKRHNLPGHDLYICLACFMAAGKTCGEQGPHTAPKGTSEDTRGPSHHPGWSLWLLLHPTPDRSHLHPHWVYTGKSVWEEEAGSRLGPWHFSRRPTDADVERSWQSGTWTLSPALPIKLLCNLFWRLFGEFKSQGLDFGSWQRIWDKS